MGRGRLRQALDQLERDGALEPGQRLRVEEHLADSLFPRRDRMLGFVGVLSLLGAVLVGTGVIYFIASNWDQIGKGARLALIFAVILGSHHFGFQLAEKPGRLPKTGRALTGLGVLCFGGAIALIAQIYHLHSEYPHFLLAWFLLNIPFALLTRSRAILLLLVGLFTIWVIWQTGVWFDLHELDQDENIGTAFCMLGLGYAAMMKGLATVCTGTRFDRFEIPLRAVATPASLAGMYALSFRGTFLEEQAPGADWIAFVPGALLFLLAAALFAPTLRRRSGHEDLVDSGGLLLAGLILLAGIRLFPGAVFLVANLLLLAAFLVLIIRGVSRGIPLSINLGIGGFLVVVMTRYFEYLADRMDNAVLGFIGAGLLLLTVGLWLERRRRALLDQADRAGEEGS